MVRAKVVTMIRWYAQDEVNQEESEHNEVDGMKKGDAYLKERLVIWSEKEDTDGRARVTAVLPQCPINFIHGFGFDNQ